MLQTFTSGNEMREHYKKVRARLNKSSIAEPIPPVPVVTPIVVKCVRTPPVVPCALEPVIEREAFIPPAPMLPRPAAMLLGAPGTPAKEAPGPAPLTVRRIVEVMSVHTGVSVNDIRSERRTANIIMPRQVAMYLARHLTLWSFPQIGLYFSGRDHTTVIHAVRKITRLRLEDPDLDDDISNLTDTLLLDVAI